MNPYRPEIQSDFCCFSRGSDLDSETKEGFMKPLTSMFPGLLSLIRADFWEVAEDSNFSVSQSDREVA